MDLTKHLKMYICAKTVTENIARKPVSTYKYSSKRRRRWICNLRCTAKYGNEPLYCFNVPPTTLLRFPRSQCPDTEIMSYRAWELQP